MEQFFIIEAIGAALLGIVLGSFINALSFRYGTGVGLGGRSRCMHCRHTLKALDLVPILSYLYLGGKCRYCGSKIALQYPLVEFAGGVLSLAAFILNPAIPAYALALLMWMTLLFAVVYDLRHLSLPIPALWIVGTSGLFSTFVSCGASGFCAIAAPSALALLAGPLVASPLLLFSAVSGGRLMGWGDGLLVIGLGWFVGITAGFTALCFAFWSGAVVGLALIGMSRLAAQRKRRSKGHASGKGAHGFTMVSEIPFAPFLLFGFAVVYFFRIDLFSILLV